MTQTILLMADYFCHPLWWRGGHEPDNIDPDDLPISPALRAALASWAAVFDSWLDMSDPGNSPDPPTEALAAFEREGLRLQAALRLELGPDWHVLYSGVNV